MTDTRRHIAANDVYPDGGYWQQHDDWTVTYKWVRSPDRTRITAWPMLAHRQCARCGDALAVPVRGPACVDRLAVWRHTCNGAKR